MNPLKEEKRLWRKGKKIVVGLDEAGRGPLAGPVVAAAVFINRNKINRDFRSLLGEIKDSKKLSFSRREKIFEKIVQIEAISFSFAKIYPRVIERINIFEATKLAMRRSLGKIEKIIGKKADFLLIDGNFTLPIRRRQRSIIKGDERVVSIMLASIVAKVKRDRMMIKYHKRFPQYAFDKNKGYPTKFHKSMIKKYGPCPLHRFTFKGVK